MEFKKNGMKQVFLEHILYTIMVNYKEHLLNGTLKANSRKQFNIMNKVIKLKKYTNQADSLV